MENWGVDGLSKIGCVSCGSTFAGNGGETNLVIYDDVNGSSNRVVGQVLHLHGFINDSLTRKGCVSVDKHWHNSSSFIFVA